MENVCTSDTKRVWFPNGHSEEITRTQFKNLVIHNAKEIQPDFKLDAPFKKLIQKLELYFWQDPAFESEGHGKLNKGIFLTGNTGVGKTLMMRMFRMSPRRLMRVVSTNTVCDSYQENGIEHIISVYGNNGRANYQDHLCFDDLGCERLGVKHMGSELHVMERLIYCRYDLGQHHMTHFTTNLDGGEIEQLYGSRVRSRLREMVNFFELGGTDRRK